MMRISRSTTSQRIRCDQPETNISISTEEHTSQQSDNDTPASLNHYVYLGRKQPRGSEDSSEALTAHEQEIISLRVKLEAKDRELHLIINFSTIKSLNTSHVPDYFQYCTCFTYDQFNILCDFFSIPSDPNAPQTHIPLAYKHVDNEISKLTLRSQLLLTLMKLRQNLDHKDLAFRFQIRLQSVSTLINSWVDYMFDSLGKLSVWPHRDIISEHMPAKFKEQFPNTFAILDGTELKIEKPRSLSYSTYKSTNTLKSLVACDPRGAVIYVSTLFTGSISDKEIFNRCNIIDILKGCVQCGYLNVGDGLMVDKGFLIEKEVEEIGLKLNIPPFARANRQMPHADVDMTKKIAKHRVHVERAIAKIKKFKIVSGRIPITQTQ
ncbi:hypothetical protein N1851_024608 [Merluccius polli]|uniref:DDE Tnp4 domain-containing protein n=1 Tax=Merluccius polli TaxID=89951 RepID=A0AA47MEV2_MERPO|nr:hypothetical protein N1851_024608 [Merluccius polli]